MKEVSALNINKLVFRNFKTLEDVSFEPGRVKPHTTKVACFHTTFHSDIDR